MGRGDVFAQFGVGVLHGLAGEGAGDGGVHHEFGEAVSLFIEGVDGAADELVFTAFDAGFQLEHGGLDVFDFIGGELLPALVLLALGDSFEDGGGFVLGLDDLAFVQVVFGVVEAVEDHGFDLVVGEAVAGLDVDCRGLTAALFACRDLEDAVGIDEELDLDAGHAGGHGRDVFEVEAGEGAAVLCKFTLALDDVDGDVSLAVDAGGEVLRCAGRDGAVALDDFGDDAAEGLDAERERGDVKQQEFGCCGGATGENVGLDGGAEGYDFVGVELCMACLSRAESWKTSSTRARTAGMRVLPPTRTTSSMSAGVSCASLTAWRAGAAVR